MKIMFLGSGSAFTVGDGNWQSNLLIESDSGKKLLVDCGSDARFSLDEAGVRVTDIDAVYVSHPHADHIGGLEWMAFATKFAPNPRRPKLFISRMWLGDLWNKSLSGGLESIEGEVVGIEHYFEPKPVRANGWFDWEGTRFTLVQVIHIMDGFRIVPSFGLMFHHGGQTVFFTSDTQFAPNQIGKFYAKADVILQDCETAPWKSGVHAHYSELLTLPPETRAKMWLYHCQPGEKPDSVSDGFKGFAPKGMTITL